jgi:hypothetical protein
MLTARLFVGTRILSNLLGEDHAKAFVIIRVP